MTQSTIARRRDRRRRKAALGTAITLGVVAVAWASWRFIAQPGTTSANAATSGLDRKAIAILYFRDLSRDTSFGYVADALTEGLIRELSSVSGLNVVSRNGVAPFRGTATGPDSIARALGTGTLIQGSIEPVGNRLRVNAWLVDGNSGADMERSTFELPASRLLKARDSVVREVALLLRKPLGEEIRVRESRAGTANVDAWSLVQRAERLRKEAFASREQGALDASVATYLRADSLLLVAEKADPRWAEPVALRSQLAYERSSMEKDLNNREAALDTAVAHAARALLLEPGNAAALSLRGRARRSLYNLEVSPDRATRSRLLDSAEADLKAATDADGTQAEAFFALSLVYYDRKDNVSAALAARRAYEADAFLRNQHINLRQLFWAHYDLEQFPDANRWCQEGARRFPQNYAFAECQLWLMLAQWKPPDIALAWALAAQVEQLAPEERRPFEKNLARLLVSGALARATLSDSARRVLASIQASREIDPEQELSGYSAIVHIILGEFDEAIALLKGYVVQHPTHEFTVGRDLHWWWRPLQGRPGFDALAERRR